MHERNCSTSSQPQDERVAEHAISQAFGLPAAYTDRASLAIQVILRDITPGAVVALAPVVCQDVISAVISAGCTPLFVDLDPATTEVPASEWERARDAGATVAIAVHLFGIGQSLTNLKRIFAGEDLLIIDDAAQAVGTKVGTGFAGTHGTVGILSFGPSKQLPVGGAAVLTREAAVLDLVRKNRASANLSVSTVLSEEDFRTKLDVARGQLAQVGRSAASHFQGLLEGYQDLLNVVAHETVPEKIAHILPQLGELRERRMRKFLLWRSLLVKTRATFFEYTRGANPWRATFRVPGIGWEEQAALAEEMRSHGVPVSTWYLPGHWFLDGGKMKMDGAERLSREVFQLWIDETTTEEQIHTWAPVVQATIGSRRRSR